MKINILGAPGAGVSTLGKALAGRLGYPFFDTDDYYWFTGDALPFRRKRNPEHRRQLLLHDLEGKQAFVLSGALPGWGDALVQLPDILIYRWLPVEIRLKRIADRETLRYGAERLTAGGDLESVYLKFKDWAAGYDARSPEQWRSRSSEMAWLETALRPVLILEDDLPVDLLIDKILLFIHAASPGTIGVPGDAA